MDTFKIQDHIIGLSIGEYCGDTIVIHLEKAAREYKGIYQFLAQEFARHFFNEKIIYLNREDDAGVLGLRKSKQQYQPCLVYDGWVLEVNRLFDTINTLPTITNSNNPLKLGDLLPQYYQQYFQLCSDLPRSLSGGGDYQTELQNGQVADQEFFVQNRQECIANKEEYSGIIYLQDQLIGEVSLHNLDYHSHVEIGIRILPQFEHQGWCKKACQLMLDQCFNEGGLATVGAKCYLDNISSYHLLSSLGMSYLGKDDIQHYFYLGDYFDPRTSFQK